MQRRLPKCSERDGGWAVGIFGLAWFGAVIHSFLLQSTKPRRPSQKIHEHTIQEAALSVKVKTKTA